MDQDKKTFPQKLSESSKVAIVVGPEIDPDILHSVVILNRYIISKGKEAILLVGGELTADMRTKLQEQGVNVQDSTNPTSYVVSIDYGKTGLDKVRYDIDEKSGKVNFYLTPSQGEFDFNQVEYRTEGNNFDVVVTLGITSFSQLGKLYESSKKLFTDLEVYSILRGEGTLGDHTVNLSATSSNIYGVKILIGSDVDAAISTEILTALLKSEPLLEGVPSAIMLNEASDMIGSGADWAEALRKAYYDKTYVNLDLQIKLMHNLMVDRENRVIWSKVSSEHVKFAGVDEANLDTKGRIIFNISSEFDLAFAVYELKKDTLDITVESNIPSKYSAEAIAAVFGGEGDERQAHFKADNMSITDFENKVFLVLHDMFGINVYGSSLSFRSGEANAK